MMPCSVLLKNSWYHYICEVRVINGLFLIGFITCSSYFTGNIFEVLCYVWKTVSGKVSTTFISIVHYIAHTSHIAWISSLHCTCISHCLNWSKSKVKNLSLIFKNIFQVFDIKINVNKQYQNEREAFEILQKYDQILKLEKKIDDYHDIIDLIYEKIATEMMKDPTRETEIYDVFNPRLELFRKKIKANVRNLSSLFIKGRYKLLNIKYLNRSALIRIFFERESTL